MNEERTKELLENEVAEQPEISQNRLVDKIASYFDLIPVVIFALFSIVYSVYTGFFFMRIMLITLPCLIYSVFAIVKIVNYKKKNIDNGYVKRVFTVLCFLYILSGYICNSVLGYLFGIGNGFRYYRVADAVYPLIFLLASANAYVTQKTFSKENPVTSIVMNLTLPLATILIFLGIFA